MKKLIFFLVLACSFSAADAQSLKDLLYSGKLKNDSNTVIRKTDDLSTKIDTGQRKAAEAERARLAALAADSIARANGNAQPALASAGDSATDVTTTDSAATTDEASTAAASPAAARSNTKIWKDYTDSLSAGMKSELQNNKKVKKGTYYITVDYEIETTGEVIVSKVTVSPENDLLANQVKSNMASSPPQLAVVMDSTNKPRKVKRKQNFTITKD